MLIVADENIPLLDAFFRFRRDSPLPGRAIDAASVKDADVLLVRSVTKVDRQLLEGSRCALSAPAPSAPITWTWTTSRSRHPLEQRAGLQCPRRGRLRAGQPADPGRTRWRRAAKRVYGVVGAGEVGGRLVRVLHGLGWKVLVCDPLRQAAEGATTSASRPSSSSAT
jgi:erythronate-4-phosphate dehydrogenase